eukprot:TRINITY_DN203132_c0_g1_i1.p1 TRINITY_DN203132_c0_g1~~TRINITY_DN203132_c0_g1_i1.p1  ORF type:complete len:112 (-),score=10.70 TRINITY_DN203132_c0_g1_i1:36-371(-)
MCDELQVTRSQSLPSLAIDKQSSLGVSTDGDDYNGIALHSARSAAGSAAVTTRNKLQQIQQVVTQIRETGHAAQSHREKIAHLLGAAQRAVSALEWYAQRSRGNTSPYRYC